MTIISVLTNQQVKTFRDQIVSIYRDAFSVPPYSRGEPEIASFAQSLPRHMGREAFCFVAALEGNSEQMVGFAYGYTSARGQWWYENVRKALSPPVAAEWLANSFQLVEIAVTPQAQGRGIGSLLHDRLLGQVRHEKAVLSTLRAETVAHRLYQKRGWVILLESFFFPGVGRPYRIMGLDLDKTKRWLSGLGPDGTLEPWLQRPLS